MYAQPQAKLVSLTVADAAQNNVSGTENWVAVKKKAADVFVEATTAPKNNPDEWKQIRWSGDIGNPVPSQPNRRSLSRAVSKKFHVEAALGGVSHYVDVWILWAAVEIMTKGVRPSNAAPFDPGTRDNSDKLGAVTYLSFTESVIDEAAGVFVKNMGASGKVAPVATLSPKGIHAVVNSGWAFERMILSHEWRDSSQVRMDEIWIRDTSNQRYLRLTPTPDDHIYDLDGPDIRWGQGSSETYNNFQQWVEWNNERCSELALWYWQARWRLHKDPNKQIILKDLGTGNITLPSKQFFTVLSRFDRIDASPHIQGGARIQGGASIEAKLTLYQKASPGGVLVTVTSDHPNDVSPRSPVQVLAGQDSATFAISTRPVDADLNFMLTATVFGPGDKKYYGGTVRAPRISELRIPKQTPANKKGNKGKIVLDGPAGPHTQVDFGPDSHRLPNVIPHIDELVTVPQGATECEFKYDTAAVETERSGSITASLNGTELTSWTKIK
jgi:hypothetical protein